MGIAVSALLAIFIYSAKQKKMQKDTQRLVSDRELLRIIEGKIDGFTTAEEIATETKLTKGEAKARLLALGYTGILRTSLQNMTRYHFELTRPIKDVDPPELSPEPFLTADDVLKLFKLYDYRLDYQDLIMATGLPLGILQREMKYFVKEKMVKAMYKSMGYGSRSYRFFLLAEPYRSNPDSFIREQETVDLRLKELLKNDQLI
ncbi:hypothetical protein CEQ90_01895 [Lewinellaceae bacterium SD302]|nr:hypothetical protein CEQ90_01895 [Lewinellaceae bacterium SD302]